MATREAFFALMRLLRFVGHAVPRRRADRASTPRYSHGYSFHRLPAASAETWAALLRRISRQAVTDLSWRLLEHAGARARSGEVGKDLRCDTLFLKFGAAAHDAQSAFGASSRYPSASHLQVDQRLGRPATS